MSPPKKLYFGSVYWLFAVLILMGLRPTNISDLNLQWNLLSQLETNSSTWKQIESFEEQPITYLGGSPRDLAFSLNAPERPQIPSRLKSFGEQELVRLLEKLQLPMAEFETWVTYNNWGNATWAISRYRHDSQSEWRWLDSSFENPAADSGAAGDNSIILPRFLKSGSEKTWDEIFNNTPQDLYQRPSFGSVLWLDSSGTKAIHAWLSPSEMEKWEPILKNSSLKPVILPPPSRLGEKPVSFVVQVRSETVIWPKEFEWVQNHQLIPQPKESETLITRWPVDFKDRFWVYLNQFSGGTPITSPLNGKLIDSGKLGVGESDNQLLDVVAYLKNHYEKLGFGSDARSEVSEQKFSWRGIPQANLVVRIKGSLPKSENKAVILSDHIDKAIAEDIYEKTGERITTPGADDNATATASLLMAAEILKERYRNSRPRHDIYFVHFTGEEYPGSCLGTRYFISDLLNRKIDVGANIDLDMLGHRTHGDKIFQINPGFSETSWKLAETALKAAKVHASQWNVKVRYPWSQTSYITQTDATIFDYAGYPTILINEHMNLSRRLNPYYHQSSDTADRVDLDYATAQAKVAIETTAQMAEK